VCVGWYFFPHRILIIRHWLQLSSRVWPPSLSALWFISIASFVPTLFRLRLRLCNRPALPPHVCSCVATRSQTCHIQQLQQWQERSYHHRVNSSSSEMVRLGRLAENLDYQSYVYRKNSLKCEIYLIASETIQNYARVVYMEGQRCRWFELKTREKTQSKPEARWKNDDGLKQKFSDKLQESERKQNQNQKAPTQTWTGHWKT
jgi:hypothetical protein